MKITTQVEGGAELIGAMAVLLIIRRMGHTGNSPEWVTTYILSNGTNHEPRFLHINCVIYMMIRVILSRHISVLVWHCSRVTNPAYYRLQYIRTSPSLRISLLTSSLMSLQLY